MTCSHDKPMPGLPPPPDAPETPEIPDDPRVLPPEEISYWLTLAGSHIRELRARIDRLERLTLQLRGNRHG